MKKLFSIAVLLVAMFANVSGQELLIDKVDPFDKTVNKTTRPYCYEEMCLVAMRVGSDYGLIAYSTRDIGCSGATGNYINFLFEDGTTMRLNDIGDIDCKDKASSVFLVKLSAFGSKNIVQIRLRQSQGTLDVSTVGGQYSIQELFKAVN